MKLLEILLLILPPLIWALWNDRNGDDHKTFNDIYWISWFIIMSANAVYWIEDCNIRIYFRALAVSITGYALLFPYCFNWYWYSKNRIFVMSTAEKLKWKLYYTFNHLSDTAIPDRWKWWRACGWFGRLLIYLVLFVGAVYWFLA